MNRFRPIWLTRGLVARSLLPVAWLFQLLVSLRRQCYRRGWCSVLPSAVPVIVVGNISVGGTGKSPLTQALVIQFQALGWRPGIVSRGYGGQPQSTPLAVCESSKASVVGDEPLMLARTTGVPVCVCTERAQAVAHLAQHSDVDLVFSDDGLQHYAMARQFEIAVVDAQRGLGNGWMLPAGPLREPVSRLRQVDWIAAQMPAELGRASIPLTSLSIEDVAGLQQIAHHAHNFFTSFRLRLIDVCNLQNFQTSALENFRQKRVHAIAGIAFPQRFFDSLEALGILVIAHPKPDHHFYSAADFNFSDDLPILVTSKDAVKITTLAMPLDRIFEVRVSVEFNTALRNAITQMSDQLRAVLAEPSH